MSGPRYVAGVAGIGVYLPEGVHTPQMISARSGIPVEVIVGKFGVRVKRKAGPEEHVSGMAVRAGLAALADAGVSPEDLDLIIYCGSSYKDRHVWSAAAAVQHGLGARRAYAFEVYALCAGGVTALKVASDMMAVDPALRHVLVVAASRESDLIDYGNERARFMFNFGDGAAAALLRRDAPANRLLGFAALTDGSFADDVFVAAGGSRFAAAAGEARLDGAAGEPRIDAAALRLDVADPASMKRRLDPVSMANFLRVIDRALGEAGLRRGDLDFVAPVHMKRSMHGRLLGELGLSKEQAFYLEDFGHVQAADPLIGLHEAARRGLLRDGAHVLLVAAGTGYTWAAAVIRWGHAP